MSWSEEKVREVVGAILRRSAEDAEFHARAIADPSAAIREVSGETPPSGVTIRFVALEGADFCYVLPDPQVEGELSDSDLESVAGGRSNSLSQWDGSAFRCSIP